MQSNQIVYSVSEQVATITLNRPERGNALTPAMVSRIIEIFQQIEADSNIHIVILTGSGKFFCTGMDLQSDAQAEMSELLQSGSIAERALQMFESVKACSKPTIARVNGPAMGGGWGLVFCTDLRVVVKSASFTLSEVKVGVVPALISAFVTPQLGPFLTKQLMLSGKKIGAEEAFRLGCISSLVDTLDQLDSQTHAWIAELSENGPQAMAKVKRAVQFVWDHSHEENKKFVKILFEETVHAPEARYGMSCFAKKQKPKWAEFSRSKL